jgi:hypothetical protein
MTSLEAKEYGLVDEVLGDTSKIVAIDRKTGELRTSSGEKLLDILPQNGTGN